MSMFLFFGQRDSGLTFSYLRGINFHIFPSACDAKYSRVRLDKCPIFLFLFFYNPYLCRYLD